MAHNNEVVHVHSVDARTVIEAYRLKGLVLVERTKPTIIAQQGYVRLVFASAEEGSVPFGPECPSEAQSTSQKVPFNPEGAPRATHRAKSLFSWATQRLGHSKTAK
jgi:hypothetical protein